MYFQASENLFHWFHSSDSGESRPAMIAPDPFALPKPDPTEESDYHLPLGTISSKKYHLDPHVNVVYCTVLL